MHAFLFDENGDEAVEWGVLGHSRASTGSQGQRKDFSEEVNQYQHDPKASTGSQALRKDISEEVNEYQQNRQLSMGMLWNAVHCAPPDQVRAGRSATRAREGLHGARLQQDLRRPSRGLPRVAQGICQVNFPASPT